MAADRTGRCAIYGPCPECAAAPSMPCKRPSGHEAWPPHSTRPTLAPCPECDEPVLERDLCQLVAGDYGPDAVFAHNRCVPGLLDPEPAAHPEQLNLGLDVPRHAGQMVLQ